jgi:hypothetical protein
MSGTTGVDLNRLLIEDFYQDSVERYGRDSDQAYAFASLLRRGGPESPAKIDS